MSEYSDARQAQRMATLAMVVEQIEGGVIALQDETDARMILRRAECMISLRETLDNIMTAIILGGTVADRDKMREITASVPDIDASELLAYML